MPAPRAWNRYSYALNNPARFTDPTGMSSTPTTTEEEKKRQQQEHPLRQARQQVVHVTESRVINQRIAELNSAATPLAPGEAAVPTNAEHIVGEQIQLYDAIVIMPGEEPLLVANGYMRAAAVVVTDQTGKVMIDPNFSVTERVTAVDDNAKALEAKGDLITSNNKPVPQQSNGAFVDVQLRGMGQPNSRFSYQTTQELTVRSGRRGLFKFEGIQIRTDDATRSITMTPGNRRKFY